MATSVQAYTHVYQGDSSTIKFCVNERQELSVNIDTKRLHLRSVEAKESDYKCYADLYGDKDVMEKFADTKTKTPEEIKKRIDDIWVKRWNSNDPYSSLAVFKKEDENFVGHLVLGHGEQPRQSEVAYLFMKNCWNQKYGTEAVSAVVKEYAPATRMEGYTTLEGQPLEEIVATSRIDNPASGKILQDKLKMNFVKEEEKFGALRNHYSLLLTETSKFSALTKLDFKV